MDGVDDKEHDGSECQYNEIEHGEQSHDDWNDVVQCDGEDVFDNEFYCERDDMMV